MVKNKLIRIATVPISLEKLLEGQLYFMKSDFKVTAISSEKKRLLKFGVDNGVEVFHLKLTRKITLFKDVFALIKLVVFFKKEKPHIVHTHTPKAGIVGMLAAKIANVPIRLHTVAGLPLLEAKGFKRSVLNWVEKLTYTCATMVYPNSKGLYQIILNEKFTSQNKLKIIGNGSSNGIDTSYFNSTNKSSEQKKKLRDTLEIKENTFVFIFVGRLVGDKGINELIAAFKKLQNTSHLSSHISLLLVGPLESNLDPLMPETLKEIKTNPDIIATGYQEDVRPYFAIANALVFPSYREGFPNVVMQAGAMGLPSIVSDINGCNEIIINNENGIIVPPKNEKELFKAMERLITNRNLHQKLSKNARELITSRYERKQIWEEILAEYKSLENKYLQ